ncbi:hypothetical protein KP509_12G015200 [Ceratopteris richardii]|nr:hypothetical protein KP509_12G015200 [Ceratopteris richardii]
MELDLSNLSTMHTMFAALFSKLGVPIKTSISPYVLEEAIKGTVTIRPLPLGRPVNDRVEKQAAHFFGVTLTEEQAADGVIVRVVSHTQSKFKLLYFEQEENGSLHLVQQEDSMKTGKITSAGMYFLHFQVYRLDLAMNVLTMAKDPETAFLRKLEGLQACDILELKAGPHIFSVYGDNFFKSASYTIEAVSAELFKDSAEKLKAVEAQLLSKRNELKDFEIEYKEVLARFTAVSNRLKEEKVTVDKLLKSREAIHASFSTVPQVKRHSSCSNLGNMPGDERAGTSADESPCELRDRHSKKKWFNMGLKSERKAH